MNEANKRTLVEQERFFVYNLGKIVNPFILEMQELINSRSTSCYFKNFFINGYVNRFYYIWWI